MTSSTDELTEVKALIQRAKKEQRRYQPAKAITYYKQALDLIPDPVEDSPYATQICTALGEIYFLDRDFEKAFEYFAEAIRCKGGLGLAHIHLRLGQLRFERGEMERATDELMRAYMGSGYAVFEGEDPKYYNLIKDVVERKRP